MPSTAQMGAMVLLALLCGAEVRSAPYEPADDSIVLMRLPHALLTQRPRAEFLREKLREDVTDLDHAVALAAIYVDAAKEGDSGERYYGQAEAVLRPWLSAPSLPPTALALRAHLHQHFHRFDAAVLDYRQLARQAPTDVTAWFGLAMALQYRGEVQAAMAACHHLWRLNPRAWKMCSGYVASVSPHIRQGYGLLQSALDGSGEQGAAEQVWILTSLGEAAARLERPADADRFYRLAMDLAPGAVAVVSSYGDFLIDQGRYADALKVLEHDTRTLAASVRRCIVYLHTNSPALQAEKLALAKRLELRKLRGDAPHYLDEIRAHLQVFGDPDTAVRLALENWQSTKTPVDARWLLETAVASNNAAALRAARAWLEGNAETYPMLARIAAMHASGRQL